MGSLKEENNQIQPIHGSYAPDPLYTSFNRLHTLISDPTLKYGAILVPASSCQLLLGDNTIA